MSGVSTSGNDQKTAAVYPHPFRTRPELLDELVQLRKIGCAHMGPRTISPRLFTG